MEIPNMNEKEFLELINRKSIKMTPALLKAIEQVKLSHENQERDDGAPYLEQHIYPVATDVINSFNGSTCPSNVVAGALLHDVIEDDENMNDVLFVRKFGPDIYGLVKPLTKRKEDNNPNMNQKEKMEVNKVYLQRLINVNKYCRLIKLADRTNNISCIILIKDKNPKKFERYVKETEENFLPFAEKESEYFHHKMNKVLGLLKEN